jgi:aminomethyltransferase
MLCVNSGTTQKDFDWIKKHADNLGTDLENVSTKTAKIDVQGPFSNNVLKKLVNEELPTRFKFINTRIDNVMVILSRTGYTGEDGFELFFEPKHSEHIWNLLLDAGKEFNIAPAGLGARDSLRLEACYPLYGHELNENITPLEAGLGFAVSLDKDHDFTGKKALLDLKQKGLQKKLVALELIEKGIPREGYEIYKDENKIGEITSGTFSPTFKKGIALGYVNEEFSEPDTPVKVKIRDKFHDAIIKKKPLYSFKGDKSK